MRLFVLLLLLPAFVYGQQPDNKMKEPPFGLVIHGGAGTILKKNMTPEKERAYEQKLQEALDAGYKILEKGGKSVDAIQAAITILEDSPLFNAGKGAVFTHDETNEMDASIMDGKTLHAGAVAGVKTIKNPINGARLVMDRSQHVMLSGEGADAFAKMNGLEIVDPEYFRNEIRLKQLRKIQDREKTQLDHDDDQGFDPSENEFDILDMDKKYGTVGAVALDKQGNLAAGTSTGGMTNKRYGRIGDSPIIGAGTYANNETCAVSCTGHGEFFIRNAVAYDVNARMMYKRQPLKEAAREIILKTAQMGGKGGLISIDRHGEIATPFSTKGMYRGWKMSDGREDIKMYKEE